VNILAAVKRLFARWFSGESWAAWLAFLAALFALPMTKAQRAIYAKHTGRSSVPEEPAREAFVIVGRRGGKSIIAALIAVYVACFRKYDDVLAPGEVGTVVVVAADRKQARVILRYINGFFDHVQLLGRLIVNRTKEAIELSNRVVIEIHTASFRNIRGYTAVAAICDEVAFWRSEDSANPDAEILNALRPAMATVPGALLLCISSPYSRRGVMWEAFRRYHGKDGSVLVWQSDTRSMNPTVSESIIKTGYEQDPQAAAAEYGGEFRTDVETFVSREAVEAVVIPGRRELPPAEGLRYVAFVDPSGGSSDSMTLAVAHRGEKGRTVLDCVRERKPPFSPPAVVEEFVAVLKRYRVGTVTGDAYSGEWVREAFVKRGVTYRVSGKPKSELYLGLLPLVNSGGLELLDIERLVNQLCSLERRTGRSGRDSVDHPPRSHDDVIDAAAGGACHGTGEACPGMRTGQCPEAGAGLGAGGGCGSACAQSVSAEVVR